STAPAAPVGGQSAAPADPTPSESAVLGAPNAPAQTVLAPVGRTYATNPSPYLKKDLEEVYKRSRVKGRLAFSVYSTRYGRIEASLNDTEWFTPASCLKLIVTAAALDTFPVNFFPATLMDVFGTVQNRTLTGKIRISGEGDPNVSDRFFPDALSPLEPFLDSLKALGIDTIRGAVEVTDTFFTGPRRPEAWKQHHFNTWYGAEVSALSYNDNTFTLSVLPGARPGSPAVAVVKPDVGYVRIVNKARTVAGRKRRIVPAQNPDSTVITLSGYVGNKAPGFQMILPVRNPTQYFRASVLKSMASHGFVMRPDTVAAGSPLVRSFRFTTAPLIDVVEEINQRSQNLHAEMTLRQLGKFVKGDGSAAAGIRAEKEFLHRQGLDTNDFQLHDGCGLSSRNHIKPRAMAGLLAAMARHRYARDYITSLASPGLDGATGRRMRPYMQTNLLRYKTGSISGVQGLCGYAFGIDGDTLAAALFINDFRGSPESASRLMDSLLVHVALFYNKERPALIEAHKLLGREDAPLAYPERLKYFSKALLEKPYFLGPTGEGRFGRIEATPLIDLDRFDCVTYIESAMSLALSRQTRDMLPRILALRYRSDTLDYATRNHYFVEDWLRNNASLVRVVRFPGDSLLRKPIDKIKFFSSKQLPAPAANPIADIAFMPYAKALEMMSDRTWGEKFLGVAFVTDIPGLDVTHTGFLVADGKNPPVLRNASQLQHKVVDMPFKEYLESRKGKCAGVLFFEFLPPPI
ncbi:MAG TPA: D-alanyl-D-alanine carboxypeptidase/D-alanyl-D-alanine-endopeptidase, partial [Fibrobacteria bacterium]|nr:D-alanyl-D-alanine carboxypeptidase/D-alanyl-D-alanine-endopeptidase [Fibrobacteria bacterium]